MSRTAPAIHINLKTDNRCGCCEIVEQRARCRMGWMVSAREINNYVFIAHNRHRSAGKQPTQRIDALLQFFHTFHRLLRCFAHSTCSGHESIAAQLLATAQAESAPAHKLVTP